MLEHPKLINLTEKQYISTSWHFFPQKEVDAQFTSAGSISWLQDSWSEKWQKVDSGKFLHTRKNMQGERAFHKHNLKQGVVRYVHFFAHRLQVRRAPTVAVSPTSLTSPAIPQILHIQLGQCQSPGGSIWNKEKMWIYKASTDIKSNFKGRQR